MVRRSRNTSAAEAERTLSERAGRLQRTGLTDDEQGAEDGEREDVDDAILDDDPPALALLLDRVQRRTDLLRRAEPDCPRERRSADITTERGPGHSQSIMAWKRSM